jgi:HK97 family phage prohead protease
MERKEVKFESVDVDAAGTLEGWASVFGNTDAQGDVVVPGAFAGGLSKFLERGFIGWHHDMTVPVAYPTAAREDARGLFVAARFHTTADGQRARTIASERITAGKSTGLSIGYLVKPGGARKRADGVRELRDLELLEVSLVMLPANELATVTAVKSQDAGWTPAEHDALRQQARIRQARYEGELLRAEHLELRRRLAELNDADYFEVRASAVPLETKSAVTAVLEKARDELGIAMPRVRYFRPARPGEMDEDRELARRLNAADDAPLSESFRERKGLRGLARGWKNEVWIGSDLVGDDLAYVVAHEARHVAQATPLRGAKEDREWCEDDAQRYGLDLLGRIASTKSTSDPSTVFSTRSVEASPDARVAAQARINALAPLHNSWRLAMRTSDSYENKATAIPEDPAEKDDARDALARAQAAFDAAIEHRDRIIGELLPTFGRNVGDHPRFTEARAAVQVASDELQEAAIRFHRVAKAQERRAIERAALEDRARVDEKLALRRARARPRGVAARIRELLS